MSRQVFFVCNFRLHFFRNFSFSYPQKPSTSFRKFSSYSHEIFSLFFFTTFFPHRIKFWKKFLSKFNCGHDVTIMYRFIINLNINLWIFLPHNYNSLLKKIKIFTRAGFSRSKVESRMKSFSNFSIESFDLGHAQLRDLHPHEISLFERIFW